MPGVGALTNWYLNSNTSLGGFQTNPEHPARRLVIHDRMGRASLLEVAFIGISDERTPYA
jgi:hypothetical protein